MSRVYSREDKVAHKRGFICRDCSLATERCYLCGMPAVKNATELPDGRFVCKRDIATVVLADEEALQICSEVKKDLDRQFIRFLSIPDEQVTLQLIDRIGLSEIYRVIGNDHTCPNTLGCTKTKLAGGKRRYEISLLSGQPVEDLKTVCVHEYAHAWINENVSAARRARIGKDAVEAFCELLAFLYAQENQLLNAQTNILENRYTRGQIHLFIAATQQYGLADMIDWMKEGDDALLIKGDLSRVRRLAENPSARSKSLVVAPTATSNSAAAVPPVALPKSLKLQGIVWSARPAATINGHNVEPGQELTIDLEGGPVRLRCLAVSPQSVTLQTNAASKRFELKLN